MLLKIGLFILLVEEILSAVVLPRPPSSPNYIPQEYQISDKKFIKKDRIQFQNTNVEKPDTERYRFVEIEVGGDGADNVETLDLHGLVQAVLNQNDINLSNITNYPNPEVVPNSILGVRDVGQGPNQRLFEPTFNNEGGSRHYLLNPPESTKNIGDEKLYYIKDSRPKVFVNFRGRTGNFRHQNIKDSRLTYKQEPSLFLRATEPYQMESKEKSSKYPLKKYTTDLERKSHQQMTTESSSVVTSSELPKQIPAPPSKQPLLTSFVHTTPVHRYSNSNNNNDNNIITRYIYAET